MPAEIKAISGILNTDDDNLVMPPMHHKMARNGVFRGNPGSFRFENVFGNIKVDNSLLPAGTNQCIGAFFNPIKGFVLFHNQNSNGRDGIFKYELATGVISKVFQCFTDSATNILNYDADYPIHSSNIVYRPDQDGDLYFWTDGLNRPCFLNLDTVAALAPFTRAMINVAKNPPLTPATTAFGNDAAVPSNNLRRNLFRFIYRWVYASGEKSTWSPISAVSLPNLALNPNDPTKNNKISISVLSSSTIDVKDIEIAGQQNNESTWTDFVYINTIKGVAINTLYSFNFYNDGAYPPVDIKEITLPFDLVPTKARAMELLNGNVIIYGNITEGVNNLPTASLNVSLAATTSPTLVNSQSVYLSSNKYQFAIIYLNEQGQTAEAVLNQSMSITTPELTFTLPTVPNLPDISVTIHHLPPADAVAYQLARAISAPKILDWITNDYQTDTDFLYICIQNLYYTQSKITGFLPTYDYSPGDRVRIIGSFTNPNLVAYNLQNDFEVIGLVDRIMTSPAITGKFLKVLKPNTFPSSPYQAKMYIRIYSPILNIQTKDTLYYEFGAMQSIITISGVKYHAGNIQNQSASQPAIWDLQDFAGDVYSIPRTIYLDVNAIAVQAYSPQSNSFSDFYVSNVNSNGRAWKVDPDAKEDTFPTLVRWGGDYQKGTNINNLNRFYPLEFDEADRARGAIKRLMARDRQLISFQERAVGQWGIYARFIQSKNDNQLTTTDDIITTNNINYYEGEYGVGDQDTAVCKSKNVIYFFDPIRGYHVRLSGDGFIPLNEIYKGQYYLRNLITPYSKPYLRTNGKRAKILIAYNFFEEEAISVLQAGSYRSGDILPYVFGWNERRNGYSSFYDFTSAEWILSANDFIITWKDGDLYTHTDQINYAKFYGTQYYPSITLVFNDKVAIKKAFNAIAYQANQYWQSDTNGDINTSMINPQTGLRQQSQLKDVDYDIQENIRYAAFLRDVRSEADPAIALLEGDYLNGVWIEVKLTYKGSQSAFLFAPYILWQESGRNF